MRAILGGALVVALAAAAVVITGDSAQASDLDLETATPYEFVPTAGHVARTAGRQQCWERRCSRSGWLVDFAIPVWIPGISGSFASGGIEIERVRLFWNDPQAADFRGITPIPPFCARRQRRAMASAKA